MPPANMYISCTQTFSWYSHYRTLYLHATLQTVLFPDIQWLDGSACECQTGIFKCDSIQSSAI